MNEAMTRKQLAAYFGMTVHWLYMLAAAGEGPPFYRLGTRKGIRYEKAKADEWLATRANRRRQA